MWIVELVLINLQRRECDPQVQLFDHLSAVVVRVNEKTAPQIPSRLLPSCLGPPLFCRKRRIQLALTRLAGFGIKSDGKSWQALAS
jgi:hypothetical protein